MTLPKWKPFPREFYTPSAGIVAPLLLGQIMVSRSEGNICAARIVEAEAYLWDDPGCHAFKGRTRRNEPMFGEEGRAYVYLIYGMYLCFNVVCCPRGVAEAVLIRGVEPVHGMEFMEKRRAVQKPEALTNGPGKLALAMGLGRHHNGIELFHDKSEVFIARDPDWPIVKEGDPRVIRTTRIGLTLGAELPLRYYLKGNRYVSKIVP